MIRMVNAISVILVARVARMKSQTVTNVVLLV